MNVPPSSPASLSAVHRCRTLRDDNRALFNWRVVDWLGKQSAQGIRVDHCLFCLV